MLVFNVNNGRDLGTKRATPNIGNAGVGRVVIPYGLTRDEYIADCYRTNTVAIWGGRGYGMFQGISVSKQVMQDIVFPDSSEDNERGSAVVWIKDDNSQRPVIVSTLRDQDEFLPLAPNQYRLKRCIGDERAIEVFLDAQTSSMFVNITGDKDESSDLNIKVISQNKDSVVNVYSDGVINVSSEKEVNVNSSGEIRLAISEDGITKTKISYSSDEGQSSIVRGKIDLVVTDNDGEEQLHASYEQGEGFSYKDEFDNEIVCKDGEINITSDKIVAKGDIQHNDGNEKMVKGDTLKDLLDQLCGQIGDICTAISTLMVTCSAPGSPSSPPTNAAQFITAKAQVESIKSRLTDILSQKSTLD